MAGHTGWVCDHGLMLESVACRRVDEDGLGNATRFGECATRLFIPTVAEREDVFPADQASAARSPTQTVHWPRVERAIVTGYFVVRLQVADRNLEVLSRANRRLAAVIDIDGIVPGHEQITLGGEDCVVHDDLLDWFGEGVKLRARKVSIQMREAPQVRSAWDSLFCEHAITNCRTYES